MLEGSVRKDKDKVRITAQVIEVASGVHIWSQTYDRTLDSIFAVQDELTFAITQALKLNLLPEQVNHEAGMTNNPQAYELFVQGRELAYQRSSDSLQRAAALLQQAIALDEQFYLAMAQLYVTYKMAGQYGGIDWDTIDAEQESLFWRLQAAPDFALKYLVLGDYAANKGQNDASLALYKRAYELAPNDPFIQNSYLLIVDDIQQSIEKRLAVLRTNPHSAINYRNLIDLYVAQGRIEDAKTLLDDMQIKFPNSTSLLVSQLLVYFTGEHNFEKSLHLFANYSGELTGQLRAVETTLLIYTDQIDKALSLMQQNGSNNPTQFDFDFANAILLLQLRNYGRLTQVQESRLLKLFEEREQKEIEVSLALLNGNSQLFIENYELTEPTEQLLKKAMDEDPTNAMLYLAILKGQGKTKELEVLLPTVTQRLGLFCSTNLVNRMDWNCQLYWYLTDQLSLEQQVVSFEKQLNYLSVYYSGISPLLPNSPIYNGVRNKPEFKPSVRQFLDETFRQTNPKLIFELH